MDSGSLAGPNGASRAPGRPPCRPCPPSPERRGRGRRLPSSPCGRALGAPSGAQLVHLNVLDLALAARHPQDPARAGVVRDEPAGDLHGPDVAPSRVERPQRGRIRLIVDRTDPAPPSAADGVRPPRGPSYGRAESRASGTSSARPPPSRAQPRSARWAERVPRRETARALASRESFFASGTFLPTPSGRRADGSRGSGG